MLGGPLVAAAVKPELAAAATLPRQVGLQSPMAEPNHLQAVVWADLTGQEALILDRSSVMAIPAVARQRHLVCGTGAGCPLVQVDKVTREPDAEQPAWLTQGHGSLSAYHRMLWTLDDVIFHPFSVWEVERQRGPLGQIVWAERVANDRLDHDQEDRLLVDGHTVSEADYLILPGPHEGILQFGGPALQRTIDNLDAAATAARNPSAYLELHYIGDEPVPVEERREHVQAWADARRGKNGGVAWTNKLIEVKEHGTHESHLLIEGRNADAVDVSRLISSPAAMADATSAGASLTYETTSGRNQQFLDYGAKLYMDSLAARLSMDDVCPPDKAVVFDTDNLTLAAPGEVVRGPAAAQPAAAPTPGATP